MNFRRLLRFAITVLVLVGLFVMHGTGSLSSATCAMSALGVEQSMVASAVSADGMAMHHVAECVPAMPGSVRIAALAMTSIAALFAFGVFDLRGLWIIARRLQNSGPTARPQRVVYFENLIVCRVAQSIAYKHQTLEKLEIQMPITNRTRRKVIGGAVLLSLSLVLAACGSTTSNDHSSMNMDHDSSSDQMHDMDGVDDRHGLSDMEDGYRLTLDQQAFSVGQASMLRFHVTNPAGKTQTDFAVDQTKLMHTYVIRNDTTNYQHLHPELSNGTFSVPATFNAAGPYRVFADFIAKDSSGKDVPLTMSSTVIIPGDYTATPLPAASNSATVDGYTVTFTGEMMAGMSHDLTATITKDGQPVTDLEPYLDTFAHLTGFNAQTLAVTHLHPHNSASSGNGGPTLMFMSEFPTSGDYRLFVQFQTAGQLHIAAVTYHVS